MSITSSKVITSVQRVRRWSQDEKAALVQETYKLGQTVSSVARQNGIFPSQLF
jgi:transposase